MENKASPLVSSDEKKTLSDNPLVSIISPVLNGIKYLEVCIQSVLNQTYPHIEHIFVDGGSTDGTLEMLSSYQTRYPERIRFTSEPDSGIGEATNKGLKMAKGELFGWLSTDDMYEEDAIATVVGFFKSHPKAYFVFGGCRHVNEKGEFISIAPSKDFNLKEAINNRHYISLTAAFYRRDVIQRIGMFNELASELDFYVRVAKVFAMHRIEKTLSSQRVHKGAVTAGKRADKNNILRETWRENYLLRRREGASIFAPSCRKYFVFLILDKLGLYYFVNTRIRIRLRRYHFVDKVLRMLGV